MIPYPTNWPKMYNTGGQFSCDMISGLCACGAWHLGWDDSYWEKKLGIDFIDRVRYNIKDE